MKRIVSFVLAVGLLTAGVSSADFVRNDTLGGPVLNIEDTSFLGRYAAGLQMFPNTVFAVFMGGPITPYQSFGVLYKFGEPLGIAGVYESNPTTGTATFDLTPLGGPVVNLPTARVASVLLGGKFSELYAGFAANTSLYDGPQLLSVVQEMTNAAKVEDYRKFEGFKTTFNPSIGLKTDMFDLWVGINSRLNLTRYSAGTNASDQWTVEYVQPAVFERLELSALMAMGSPKDTSFGLEATFGWEDTGFTFQRTTNKTKVFQTNAYEGGAVDASLAFGTKIRPTPQATLFADLVTSVRHTVPVHKKGAPPTYTVSTYWTIPAVNLGAEFEIVKNLYARISARPEYTIRHDRPAGKKGLGGPFIRRTWVHSAFSVAASTGLGWNIGAFKINWLLDVNFLNTAFLNPMAFVNINGGGPVLASAAQVNFEF